MSKKGLKKKEITTNNQSSNQLLNQLLRSFEVSKYQTEIKILLGLLLLNLIVFGQALGFPFINFDDDRYITENPMIKVGLGWESIKWAFTTNTMGHWHPLTWLSYMVDYKLFELNAGRYHLINLLLHIANTTVLFLLLRYCTKRLWPSAIVAAFFAIHPTHVEPVVWISSRKDLLSAFWGLIAIFSYAKYVKDSRRAYYFVALGAFLLSLMSKSMLITLPAVMILIDYWPLNRYQETGRLWSLFPRLLKLTLEKIPFFLLSLGGAIMAVKWSIGVAPIYTKKALASIRSTESSSFIEPYIYGFNNYFYYLKKAILPFDLAIYYPPITSFSSIVIIFSITLFLIVTIIGIWQRTKIPYLIVGWLSFWGMLFPVINLLLADRYLYLSLIGLLLPMVWVGTDLAVRFHQEKVAAVLVAIVITIFTFAAIIQTSVWVDTVHVFEHNLTVTDSNLFIYYNLGIEYYRLRDTEKAVDNLKKAISLNPDYYSAQNNLASILFEKGRLDEAEYHFRESIRIMPNSAEMHFKLGALLAAKKNFPQAIEILQKGIKLDPNYLPTYNTLAGVYIDNNQLDEAEKILREILKVNASDLQTLVGIANIYLKRGQIPEATTRFQDILKSNPNLPEIHLTLGNIYFNQNRFEEAVAAYQRAVQLRPNYPEAQQNLLIARDRLLNKPQP